MLSQAQKKYVRSLHQKKYRQLHQRFIAEGPKVVSELLASPLRVDSLFVSESHKCDYSDAVLISGKDLNAISGFKEPNGVLAVVEIPPKAEIKFDSPIILMLDGVRDPGNLGTILRVAEWFGLEQVVMSPDCADPYNPKVVQSAMGSLFRMHLAEANLSFAVEEAKANGYEVFGAEMNGESIHELAKPKNIALVMGSESHGVSTSVKKMIDRSLTIPKANADTPIDSLNVSMATGILLSALTK